jgi:hypothetical protein
MQLLTEAQECISLMDKELNHFVEALLVSAKKLNIVPFLNVYVMCIMLLSPIWKMHSFLNSVWFSSVLEIRFRQFILKQCFDFFPHTYLTSLHSVAFYISQSLDFIHCHKSAS